MPHTPLGGNQNIKEDIPLANAVIMPKAGITVESCIIGEWLKKVGDPVNVGDKIGRAHV